MEQENTGKKTDIPIRLAHKGRKERCVMRLLNCTKIRIVLVGFVTAILIGGGGNAHADFVFGTPTNLGPAINISSDDICAHSVRV
jgi:hypothetical protein